VLASGLLDALVDQSVNTHTESMIRVVLGLPLCYLGTITSLEMLRGLGHLCTTGVLSVKPLITFAVAVLPSQFIDLTVGNFLEPLAYSGRSSYE
jgi:hypothetical protein